MVGGQLCQHLNKSSELEIAFVPSMQSVAMAIATVNKIELFREEKYEKLTKVEKVELALIHQMLSSHRTLASLLLNYRSNIICTRFEQLIQDKLKILRINSVRSI